ncbi:MAG: DnaJ family molecular chaperone [Acidimicrobiales bacterium]
MKPWEVLGVSPRASKPEITTAYRALAYIFHPDRFQDAPEQVQEVAQQRMAQLNKAYDLIKKGAKDDVSFKLAHDERAHAERMERARSQPTWQQQNRERAKAEGRAREMREARERAMTNGQARPRPKARNGPAILAGIGEAVHTGKLYCRGCKSIQWLPPEWRVQLDYTDFYCSVCDRLILAR